MSKIIFKYIWLFMSIPASIFAGLVMGLWAYAIESAVTANAIGAFAGIFISFIIIHCVLYSERKSTRH
jgi:hypothetical protein